MKSKTRILSLLTAIAMLFALAGCGSSSGDESVAEEPSAPDLTGVWTQTNSSSDDMWQEATISSDAIVIYWISDDGDTKSLYWAGTFTAPTSADEPYAWESENDHNQTDSALLASSDDTKEFTYEDGEISYEASALGTTTTVRLEKTGELSDVEEVEAEDEAESSAAESSAEASIEDNQNDEEDDAEEETADDAAAPTTGEANALSKGLDYLAYSAFSYSGLIDQLEYEGYTTEEATYAADNCGADWNEQALEKAKDYLDYTAFSYTGLIDQLEYEGFTTEQATYGADNCEADWNEQAVAKAKDYIEYSSFSRSSLIDQLEYEGFTTEQAEYAADSVGY